MRLTAGTRSRLGASWDGRGTNFALFSANAEKVELCLFDSLGRRELERIELPERTEESGTAISTTYRPDSFTATAFTVPMRPSAAIDSIPTSCCSIPMPGGSPAGWCGATRISAIASAARARICRSTGATMRAACRRPSWSTRPSTGAAARSAPNIPWQDTIIYEAHVKGLTQMREDVPPGLRGTYRRAVLAGGDRSSQAARRHHGRIAAGPRAGRRPHAGREEAGRITGATTRWRSSRRNRATPRTTRWIPSAPRWRGCMTPASR